MIYQEYEYLIKVVFE